MNMMTNQANAERLFPQSNSKHEDSVSYKFNLKCQDRFNNNPDTREWLNLQNKFDHSSSEFKIFQALLDKKKTVVVKIGTSIVCPNMFCNTE